MIGGLVGQILLALLNGQQRPARPLVPLALSLVVVPAVALLALVFLAVAGFFALRPVTGPAAAAALVAVLLLLAAVLLLLVSLLIQRRPAPAAEVNPILRLLLDQLERKDGGDGKAGPGGMITAVAIAAVLGLAVGYSPSLRRLIASLAAGLINDGE